MAYNYAVFSNGNVLTAGSLMLFPQIYYCERFNTDVTPSSGTFSAVGSVFISGGLIGNSLILDLETGHELGGTVRTEYYRIFASGAGLGGGSVWATGRIQSSNNNGTVDPKWQSAPKIHVSAGSGWIPASGVWVYVENTGALGNPQSYLGTWTVWGIGKF